MQNEGIRQKQNKKRVNIPFEKDYYTRGKFIRSEMTNKGKKIKLISVLKKNTLAKYTESTDRSRKKDLEIYGIRNASESSRIKSYLIQEVN